MAIQLANVQLAYPETPNQLVLNIPSWSVARGERVFVHGPSGGGKSTLLNLLSGMLKATSGEVAILGERLDKLSSRQRDRFRANHIGYVFQQFNLIPYLDAVDNVLLANYFSKQQSAAVMAQIDELLTTLNISQQDRRKPTGKLSIGQQQRVAIARALINKPQLLIADEPTSSLDQSNRDNFMEVLTDLVKEQQTTLIFVSHDLSLASYFPRSDALLQLNQLSETSTCL